MENVCYGDFFTQGVKRDLSQKIGVRLYEKKTQKYFAIEQLDYDAAVTDTASHAHHKPVTPEAKTIVLCLDTCGA